MKIDLERGVVPISFAASHLAALFKRARATRSVIVVTQKGRPSGVILDVETFVELNRRAELGRAVEGEGEA
jgi:prevent-host-death family protein